MFKKNISKVLCVQFIFIVSWWHHWCKKLKMLAWNLSGLFYRAYLCSQNLKVLLKTRFKSIDFGSQSIRFWFETFLLPIFNSSISLKFLLSKEKYYMQSLSNYYDALFFIITHALFLKLYISYFLVYTYIYYKTKHQYWPVKTVEAFAGWL